jgi:uncharacterized protein (DUF1800 family)
VLGTIFSSREFWSQEAYRAKVKKPFELVASALRATGAETMAPPVIFQSLRTMGEMLYGCQPPTGYADTADAWVNTSALLERMNFATRLVSGNLPATRTRLAEISGGANDAKLATSVARNLLGTAPSQDFARGIAKQLQQAEEQNDSAGEEKTTRVAALVLGSPEFQRR